MALLCNVCEKPVDALSSVRCRKCQRLVCQDCLAERESGAAVCTACAGAAGTAEPRDVLSAAAGKSAAPETSAPPVARPRRAAWLRAWAGSLRRQWAMVLFILSLAILFLTISFWPVLTARYWRYRLETADGAAGEAAVARLAERGGAAVLQEMRTVLLVGDERSRRRAVQVLGHIGRLEALPDLRGIASDAEESEYLRAAAREAIVKIEEY